MQENYLLTDLGIVSALGVGVEETKKRLFLGDSSGMKELTSLSGGDRTVFGFAPLAKEEFDSSPTRIGALIDAAMIQLTGAIEKLRCDNPKCTIGAVIGTSNSTMEEFTDNPTRIDMAYPVSRLREKWGVNGPAWVVSTACSSSAKVFASARQLIANGLCDAVIVGGADAYTRTVVEGFHALEALSPNLTRPLDADRDGINLGEGYVAQAADEDSRSITVIVKGSQSVIDSLNESNIYASVDLSGLNHETLAFVLKEFDKISSKLSITVSISSPNIKCE